jgi:hypothetical protein
MVPVPRVVPVPIPHIPFHPPIYNPPDPLSRPLPIPHVPPDPTAPARPVPPAPPTPVPSSSARAAGRDDSRQLTATDPGGVIVLGLIALGALGLLTAVVVAARKSRASQGCIRIISIPPGEAPDHIRAAWVGLELPLATTRDQGQELTAMGVLSWTPGSMRGYVVEGRAALKHLVSCPPKSGPGGIGVLTA